MWSTYAVWRCYFHMGKSNCASSLTDSFCKCNAPMWSTIAAKRREWTSLLEGLHHWKDSIHLSMLGLTSHGAFKCSPTSIWSTHGFGTSLWCRVRCLNPRLHLQYTMSSFHGLMACECFWAHAISTAYSQYNAAIQVERVSPWVEVPVFPCTIPVHWAVMSGLDSETPTKESIQVCAVSRQYPIEEACWWHMVKTSGETLGSWVAMTADPDHSPPRKPVINSWGNRMTAIVSECSMIAGLDVCFRICSIVDALVVVIRRSSIDRGCWIMW